MFCPIFLSAVSGEGFLARDITVENSAGPENHQAVAVRINADFAAMYRCTLNSHQDTLYVHSFRQFYRECDIYGTIDYIFGNAAVIFQGSNIVSKLPLPGQFTVVTAQSRDTPDEDTGISLQNCSILASEELYKSAGSVKTRILYDWPLARESSGSSETIATFLPWASRYVATSHAWQLPPTMVTF